MPGMVMRRRSLNVNPVLSQQDGARTLSQGRRHDRDKGEDKGAGIKKRQNRIIHLPHVIEIEDRTWGDKAREVGIREQDDEEDDAGGDPCNQVSSFPSIETTAGILFGIRKRWGKGSEIDQREDYPSLLRTPASWSRSITMSRFMILGKDTLLSLAIEWWVTSSSIP